MGIFERLGLSRKRLDVLASPINLGIASPWQEGSLSQIVLSDLLGAEIMDSLPLSRNDAMTVPAVAKARNLLVSTIARAPLRALDKTGPIATQPAWMYRTNSDITPYERMVCTVDDGFFNGLALWLVDRGSEDQIINANYCPWPSWSVKEGKILVNDKPVDESEILLFNFSTQGLLVEGRNTIRGAHDTEAAWTGRMRNPIPLIELRITDDSQLTQAEVDTYVAAWAKARRTPDGAVGATPPGMEIKTHGEVDPGLYIENRNAVRTDVGSFANVRASMLDGTAGIDSLTYSTTQGERNSFYEFDLPFWTGPIEARLSQDDVVPRGQRTRFDMYENYAPTPTPTGAPVED